MKRECYTCKWFKDGISNERYHSHCDHKEWKCKMNLSFSNEVRHLWECADVWKEQYERERLEQKDW